MNIYSKIAVVLLVILGITILVACITYLVKAWRSKIHRAGEPIPFPKSPEYRVTGKVTHINGNTIASLAIVVSQQMLRDKKILAETTTNENGEYSVAVNLADTIAAIIVEALDGNKKILASSAVLFAPMGNNTVNLVVTDNRFTGDSVFTQNNNSLQTYWSDLSKTASSQNISVNDILFIAGQTAKDPVDVWHYIHANELQTETTIPAEVFYGLFKTGLPTSINSLINTNGAVFKDALQKAVAGNFISMATAANTDELVKKWNSYRAVQILTAKSDTLDGSLGDIFNLAIPDVQKQQQIISADTVNDGNSDNFLKIISQVAGDQAAKQMNIAMQLSGLAGFQPDMASALYADAAKMKSDMPLMELAKMNTDDWVNYINSLSKKLGKSVVPSIIDGNREGDRVNAYAFILSTHLEKKYPTQAIIGNISKGAAANGAFAKGRKDLLSFFNNNPTFDIKATPTASLLDANSKAVFDGVRDKKALVTDLQSIQRLAVYTTSFTTINRLKSTGLDSAQAILQVPKEKFITDLSASSSLSQKDSLDIYNQAAANYMHALAIFGYVHPNLHSTGATPDAPDLKELFGSLDSCDCEECNSIFSAAAYYTDCLHLLNTKATTAYTELIRRRPDLTTVLLTCKNTNTVMPYVDLVLELLENFVLTHLDATSLTKAGVNFPADPFFVNPNYQTTWQPQELAANPEHLNYSAYEQLRTTVYPQLLPFNLPLEEARVYLNHLGVERSQLMSLFFNGDKLAAFKDFGICMERLLISPEETAILTGHATGDASPVSSGIVSGLWNFYGFKTEILTPATPITNPLDLSMPILLGKWSDILQGRVDVFLQQTGISYKDLITLRLCDFINPVTDTATQRRKISIIPNATVDPKNQDTCELDLLVLDGLDLIDLKKIYRFIRLWRKLNWTMYQLDLALKTFTPAADTPAEWQNSLTSISQVDALSKKLNLPIETVLSFYSDFNTSEGYIDYFSPYYPPVNSLFAKLFQNKQVIFPVDASFADTPLKGFLDDHIPAILAALQINTKDYNDMKAANIVATNNLTLTNLSALYRHTVIAASLKLAIKDFITCKLIIGLDPFADPATTFNFLSKVNTIKTSGFSIDLVNYLLRHSFTLDTGVAPSDDVISLFLSQLRSALRGIESLSADVQKNTIAQKFSEELKISSVSAIKLLHAYLPSLDNPGNVALHIEDDFRADDFSLSPFLKTYDVPDPDPANPTHLKKIEPSKFVRANPVDVTQVVAPNLFDDYIILSKIAVFINQFKLTDDELGNIMASATVIGCAKLSALPVNTTQPASSFDAFEIMVNLIRARDLLPLGTPLLFEILNHAISSPGADPTPAVSWVNALAKRTNWDPLIVSSLVIGSDLAHPADGGVLKAVFPKDFLNGDLILRISTCLGILRQLAASPDLVATIVKPDIESGISGGIKNAAKSKYDENEWLRLAKPLRNVLRSKQREALVAYVLVHPDNSKNERWKDRNGMYDYFLIDIEMQPISITSRIKQAICSVQLFTDRMLMNLEFQNFDANLARLQASKEFADQWNEWRKVYRVWEANRQVFCYPENYILPELRTDKSPFFKDLESALNQNELNDDNVESAFGHYLEQLDQVGRLEIVGHYHQVEVPNNAKEKIDILHVFGRTFSNPAIYFHRTLDSGQWTPWLKLGIDVDGNHIVPVVFNRRLCLFWLFLTLQSKPSNSLNPKASSIPAPNKYWKIQVAWSVYHNGKWKAKRISKNFITTDAKSNDEGNLKIMQTHIFIRTEIMADNTLRLHVKDILSHHQPYGEENWLSGIFHFDNINTEPDIESVLFNFTNDKMKYLFGSIDDSDYQNRLAIYNEQFNFPLLAPVGSSGQNMMFVSPDNPAQFTVDQSYDLNTNAYKPTDQAYSLIPGNSGYTVLQKTPNGVYKLVAPSDFKLNPLEEEFFFQDSKCTFYVKSGFGYVSSLNSSGLTLHPFRQWLPTLYPFKNFPDPAPKVTSIDVDPGLFFQVANVSAINNIARSADNSSNVNVL